MSTHSLKKRWWHEKGEKLRGDIIEALKGLRAHAENISSSPSLILSPHGTHVSRSLRQVYTTRVQEWELGYRVMALNEDEGFFLRTVFIKLHGGRLNELNAWERETIIHAVGEGALDKGSQIRLEGISPTTLAFHQPFAVAFLHERNPNILVPSKKLLLDSFKLPLIGAAEGHHG